MNKIKELLLPLCEKSGKFFVVYSLEDIKTLMQTSSVVGNLQLYGIKKEKGKFLVPIESIKKQLKLNEVRLLKLQHKINLMKELLK